MNEVEQYCGMPGEEFCRIMEQRYEKHGNFLLDAESMQLHTARAEDIEKLWRECGFGCEESCWKHYASVEDIIGRSWMSVPWMNYLPAGTSRAQLVWGAIRCLQLYRKSRYECKLYSCAPMNADAAAKLVILDRLRSTVSKEFHGIPRAHIHHFRQHLTTVFLKPGWKRTLLLSTRSNRLYLDPVYENGAVKKLGVPLRDFLSQVNECLEKPVANMVRAMDEIERIESEGLEYVRQTNEHLAGLIDGVSRSPVHEVILPLAHTREKKRVLWLLLTGRGGGHSGRSCLVCTREQDEFVLENRAGQFFYFAPTVLAAMMSMDGARGLRFEPPLVLQTSGYRWNHPYTGELAHGGHPLFGAFNRLDDSSQQYLHRPPACECARGVLDLKQDQGPISGSDMCLSYQQQDLRQLEDRFHNKRDQENLQLQPYFESMFRVFRHGLQLGHQENTSTPRRHLDLDAMPYPIAEASLDGGLRSKTFRYHRSPPPFERHSPFRQMLLEELRENEDGSEAGRHRLYDRLQRILRHVNREPREREAGQPDGGNGPDDDDVPF